MSRIGKQPIELPEKVKIDIKDNSVSVKGPLGILNMEFSRDITIKVENNNARLEIKRNNSNTIALWGLYRSLLANMIEGVTKGFEKNLQIIGVGYRAEIKGDELIMKLGYSHLVIMKIPQDLKIQVDKNKIIVSGIDKQRVGQMAASIRSKRKPEPYKGKGIRYEGEYVRRKAGKRAVTGPGA